MTISTRCWPRCCSNSDGSSVEPDVHPLALPELATGTLDAFKVGQAVAHYLPENAVIVDEANTSGLALFTRDRPQPERTTG